MYFIYFQKVVDSIASSFANLTFIYNFYEIKLKSIIPMHSIKYNGCRIFLSFPLLKLCSQSSGDLLAYSEYFQSFPNFYMALVNITKRCHFTSSVWVFIFSLHALGVHILLCMHCKKSNVKLQVSCTFISSSVPLILIARLIESLHITGAL